MNDNKRIFNRSDLRKWLGDTRQTALKNGSLQSLSTELITLSDRVPFEVRKLSSLRKKPSLQMAKASGRNPFLPYEQELYICHVAPDNVAPDSVASDHVILLNKFNVIDDHLLVVTTDFEAQETVLAEKEFQSILTVMGAFPMLAFYNSGAEAGAS
ncbi:hypothetical protein GZ77_10070 [Endozoicomonas montiporae]|uniref:Ap4A phosphorylase 1/2 N-terminal domain-containing protein n=1 Tax=Endozoicomonas montiporae TaxID=1027273 RepID=A0A081N879_9GAMM|nr:hypothetical protein [Endozoicomonas montiporae]KEQ14652.1 hypothetical protein GZ77_10070 [Endozoicomonas montiporae]